jgi:hypothetical protein
VQYSSPYGAAFYHKGQVFFKVSFQIVVYNKCIMKINLNQAEAYSLETFHCRSCDRVYQAKVITWVDVSRTPQVKQLLLRWQFNVVQCTHCGCRKSADTPFFYEDFQEGFMVAVFPRIPESRGEVEAAIKEKYGYYPVLEYFYDLTQLWTLLYLQEHYRTNKNLLSLSRIGEGEARTRKFLAFLKEDPMMIDIREKLTESFFGNATKDELMDLLSRSIYTLESMLPWPMDRRCVCGGDLTKEFKCCGKSVMLDDHDKLLSRHYVVYCPNCSESLAGASCESCGKVYTWKLGTVATHKQEKRSEKKQQVLRPERRPDI